MALAKAFPDNFTYEPHEPTAVSAGPPAGSREGDRELVGGGRSLLQSPLSCLLPTVVFLPPPLVLQAQGFRYPRPASVPPSPSISRHSSPHHSETEEDEERYDEDEEAEKDKQNIKSTALMGAVPEWRKRSKKGSSEASTPSNGSTPTLPSSPSNPSSPTNSLIEEKN